MRSVNVIHDCGNCGKENDISVEVDSPSDYCFNDNCEYCNEKLNVDSEVLNAVQDYFAGLADYNRD